MTNFGIGYNKPYLIVADSKLDSISALAFFTEYYKVDTSLGEFECHCGQEFTDGTELSQHINSTHTGGVWACSYLGCTTTTVYKTASSVRKHYRTTHKKIFHYQCMLCDFGHEEQTTIKKHMENKHQISGLALKCEGCGRLFGQKKTNLKSIS